MRPILVLALMGFALPGFALPAAAQVTTNDSALDSLAPPPKASPPPAPAAPAKPRAHRPARTGHAKPAPVVPPRRLPVPQVPAAPPPNPVILPPPFVMPAHPPPPPPPVPVRNDAPGAVFVIPGGTRITFGPGEADLNQTTLAALRTIAAAAIANPAMTLSITAWAPGTPDDPSTPRRLSLDRALAARAVMINAGVISERIRTVAKGMLDIGKDIPDRVEVLEAVPPPVATGK